MYWLKDEGAYPPCCPECPILYTHAQAREPRSPQSVPAVNDKIKRKRGTKNEGVKRDKEYFKVINYII